MPDANNFQPKKWTLEELGNQIQQDFEKAYSKARQSSTQRGEIPANSEIGRVILENAFGLKPEDIVGNIRFTQRGLEVTLKQSIEYISMTIKL